MAEIQATPQKSHLITTRTVEVGDRFTTGWGTLTLTKRVVVDVRRWVHNQSYVNAVLTFEDGETCTMYDGTIFHRDAEVHA